MMLMGLRHLICLFSLLLATSAWSSDGVPIEFLDPAEVPMESPTDFNPKLPSEFVEQVKRAPHKRFPKYYYSYQDRAHTSEENISNLAFIYGLTWLVYPITQPETVVKEGSLKNYKRNFGELVFDHDEPFWNWFVHPISGSQLYLYYRATGYTRAQSLGMAFISSSLFEFTVEVYTEPASVQDLYQTPVLGSILGLGIETISLYLLNTGNPIGKFFGHLINPSTLFGFYEGKIRVIPHTDGRAIAGLNVIMEF